MAKVLFFDTGPVITLVLSRLAWLLPELKKQFGGKFYITPAVHRELIEHPLQVRRFSLEALQVAQMVRAGVFEIYSKVPQPEIRKWQRLANASFEINGKLLDIIQTGEMESITCAVHEDAAMVMDERTLRLFLENNKELQQLLERRFGEDVVSRKENIQKFTQQFKNVTVIRSIELISIAYKMGLLQGYMPEGKNAREIVINSVLWAAKYNGCSVNEHEIEEIKKFLMKK